MQVWNLLHAARWKCRTQKSRQKSPSGHHRTTLSGYIFATKAHIDNRKKLVKQRYVHHMSSQYSELRPANGWDPSGSLRHPCKFQRASRLGSVTARHLVAGVSQNFEALNRGRHLCSAGRPSRWALAHILVSCLFVDSQLHWAAIFVSLLLLFQNCSSLGGLPKRVLWSLFSSPDAFMLSLSYWHKIDHFGDILPSQSLTENPHVVRWLKGTQSSEATQGDDALEATQGDHVLKLIVD